MIIYRRVLRYLKPYRRKVALSILLSLAFSAFSGLSIYLTIPLLETLFGGGNAAPVSAVPAVGTSFLPAWLLALKDQLSLVFRELVFRPDPTQSLLNICLVIVVAFLLKNLFGYLQSNLMTQIEQGLV